MADTNERDTILLALERFIKQRPGLDFGNYGTAQSYRAESRGITKDRHMAETLLRAVAIRQSISAEDLKRALSDGFSGRLSWDGEQLSYCTGQYFPTEYRKAVCAVLASALWAYWRNAGYDTGDKIRTQARKELGRVIAAAWLY